MSKAWRLTPQAEQSLYEIAQWTFQTFGPRQAPEIPSRVLHLRASFKMVCNVVLSYPNG